jgi:FkbM family methyltransferase
MSVKLLLRVIRKQLLDRFLRVMSARRRRLLAWRSMEQSGVRAVTFERDGLVWTAQTGDDIGFLLFVEGAYQGEEMRALLAWMRRAGVLSGSRDVVIDAGANIGTTCIPIVRETGCRALAIEPVANNFLNLKNNVESNSLSARILLAKKAVSTLPGDVRMSLTGTSGGHFVARDGEVSLPDNLVTGYEDVEAGTLPGIIASAGLSLAEIAIVWADVQGCELAVIESGKTPWERGIPFWAEVEPRSLVRQGSLSAFAAGAAAHFDRFIDSRDLMRLGDKASPRPIGELAGLIEGIKPEQINTDILLLPHGF